MSKTHVLPKLELCEFTETHDPKLDSYSPFCLKVIRALRHANLPYTSLRGVHPGVFKKYNPAEQLPILLQDKTAIADSTLILKAIEKLSSAPMAAQLTPEEQANAVLWEEFADTCLNGFLVASRWADDDNWPRVRKALFGSMPSLVYAFVTPKLRKKVIKNLVARDIWRAGSKACWSRFEDLLDALEVRAPEEGHWVSKSLSAADLSIFAQLASLQTALTPRQRDSLAKRKRLCRYIARIDAATST